MSTGIQHRSRLSHLLQHHNRCCLLAEPEPLFWHFLQLTVQFSPAVCWSRTGLEGIVLAEKETRESKCCVIGRGAGMLSMLEQYSSASWDLSPVLSLLALAIVSFSSWLDELSSTTDQYYPPKYPHWDFHSWDFLFFPRDTSTDIKLLSVSECIFWRWIPGAILYISLFYNLQWKH